MNNQDVVIVRTGSANLASVRAAIQRLGARPRISDDAAMLLEAQLVVLPGVGAFGAAMAQLRSRGLDDALRVRIERDRPLLAICLGMQLLCDGSEESPGVAGLGVASGFIRRFSSRVPVPQMGWNQVEPAPDASLVRPGWMYFANSYRLKRVPQGWAGATSEYCGSFAAAIQRGSVLACQFHPELSGEAGLSLIGRWLSLAARKEAVAC